MESSEAVEPNASGELVAPICKAPMMPDCSSGGCPAEGTEMEVASPQPVSSGIHILYEISCNNALFFIPGKINLSCEGNRMEQR